MIVPAFVSIYVNRQPHRQKAMELAAQKVGGNESVGSAISIIKGVNVHKEIMEERQPDEKRIFFRMKDAECLVQGLNNPAFWIQSLVNCFSCSCFYLHRFFSKQAPIQSVLRIFPSNFLMGKIIIEISNILAGVKFDFFFAKQFQILMDYTLQPVIVRPLFFYNFSDFFFCAAYSLYIIGRFDFFHYAEPGKLIENNRGYGVHCIKKLFIGFIKLFNKPEDFPRIAEKCRVCAFSIVLVYGNVEMNSKGSFQSSDILCFIFFLCVLIEIFG